MMQQEAYQSMKDRLRNILKTEEQRDRILIGANGDFCDLDDQASFPKVLQGLDQSEKAVMNRITKLKERLEDAELTMKIQRKVAHSISGID